MTDDTVAGLRGTVDGAIAEIGRVQSALSLAKDRALQTRDILRMGLEGSGRDETAAAQAAMLQVEEIVDQAISATMVATEQLAAWTGTL